MTAALSPPYNPVNEAFCDGYAAAIAQHRGEVAYEQPPRNWDNERREAWYAGHRRATHEIAVDYLAAKQALDRRERRRKESR